MMAGETLALLCGVDGELAEVAARGRALQSRRRPRSSPGVVFCEQDDALLHHGGASLFVGAGALKEGFDCIGGVDERDEARAVGFGGVADDGVRIGSAVLRDGLRRVDFHHRLIRSGRVWRDDWVGPGNCVDSARRFRLHADWKDAVGSKHGIQGKRTGAGAD